MNDESEILTRGFASLEHEDRATTLRVAHREAAPTEDDVEALIRRGYTGIKLRTTVVTVKGGA